MDINQSTVTFEEKYAKRGLDAINASANGPGWRRRFDPLPATPMIGGQVYTVGVLPKFFEPTKAFIIVDQVGDAGVTLLARIRKSDGSTVAIASGAALDAKGPTSAAPYVPSPAQNPLAGEATLEIQASGDVTKGAFSVEIVGNVFGVTLANDRYGNTEEAYQ